MHRQKRGVIWMFLIAWLLFFGLCAWFFQTWVVNQEQSTQSELVDSTEIKVIITPNRAHHYIAEGEINRHRVKLIIDTGASTVSIPSRLAKKLGLERGYPIRATTASGVVNVFPTQISSLKIGDITLSDIKGTINPHMPTDKVLLGMSALKFLKIELDQGKLVLIQKR